MLTLCYSRTRVLTAAAAGLAVIGLLGVSTPAAGLGAGTVIADQHNAHVGGGLRGAPGGFKFRPRVTQSSFIPQGFSVTPWGQVYEIANSKFDAPNTRVQVRNLALWELDKQGKRPNGTDKFTWYRTHYYNKGAIRGAAFTNSFSEGAGNPSGRAADVRYLNDGPAARVGRMAFKGRNNRDNRFYDNSNWHFYPRQGKFVRNGGTDAVFVTMQARLIRGGSTDDRGKAQYTAGCGSDRFGDSSQNFRYLGDNSIGRHKKVNNGWQTYRSINMNKANIRRFTPPRDR